MKNGKVIWVALATSVIFQYSMSALAEAAGSFQITNLSCQSKTYIPFYEQGLHAAKQLAEGDVTQGNDQGSTQGTTEGAAAAAALSSSRGTADGNKQGYSPGFNSTYTNAYNAAYNTAYNTNYPIGFAAGKADPQAYQNGYNAGTAQGKIDGHTNGYNDGYNLGYSITYQPAYNLGYNTTYSGSFSAGYSDGYNIEYNSGYSDGFATGFADGRATCPIIGGGDGGSDGGSDGASSDGGSDGASSDGASSDGGSDGASSDGASSDGGSSDGASSDGASSDGGSDGGTTAVTKKVVRTVDPSSVCSTIGNLGSWSKDPTVSSIADAQAYCTQLGCSTIVNPYQPNFNVAYISAYNRAYTNGVKANTSYQTNYQAAYDAAFARGQSDGTAQGTSQGAADGQQDGYNAGFTAGQSVTYQNGYNTAYPIAYNSAYNNSYPVGYSDGLFDGNSIGYSDGLDDGQTDGYNDGLNLGETDGAGYNSGYSSGYGAGYSSGSACPSVVAQPKVQTKVKPPSIPKNFGTPVIKVGAKKTSNHQMKAHPPKKEMMRSVLRLKAKSTIQKRALPAVSAQALSKNVAPAAVLNPPSTVTDPQNATETKVASTASLSSSNYTDGMNQTIATFHAPTNAAYIYVNFTSIDLENGSDFVTVSDANGNVCARLTGAYGNVASTACIGSTAQVVVTSDASVSGSSGYNGLSIAGYTYGVTTQASPPIAVLNTGTSGTVMIGQSVSFSGNKSVATLRGATISDYVWDFYDGSFSQKSVASHAFMTPGTYWVSLTAWDSHEGYNTSYATMTVPKTSEPVNLSAATGITTATLTWAPGGVDDKTYRLAYAPTASASGLSCATGKKVKFSTKGLTLSKLFSDTSYTFMLCGVNAFGGISNPITVQAKTLIALPPAPVKPVATATTSSITLTWTSGGGSTAGFVFGHTTGKALSCASAGSVGTQTTASVTGLLKGKAYELTVCAVNAQGGFSKAVVKSVKTALK